MTEAPKRILVVDDEADCGIVRWGYPVAMKAAAVALILAAALAACGGARSSLPAACSGSGLRGSFAVVPGSAGAGNIVYKLVVTNTTHATCTLTGTPAVRLVARTGKALPTKVMPAFRPGLTAVLVRLAPGGSAHATARFSPDVPGVGEGGRRRCEPTAYWLRVTARGKTAKVRIRPATPVCEHGQLQLSVYQPGK